VPLALTSVELPVLPLALFAVPLALTWVELPVEPLALPADPLVVFSSSSWGALMGAAVRACALLSLGLVLLSAL